MKSIEKSSLHSIVVQMPNWIGDAIMALPVLHDLKKTLPDASLTILCHQNLVPLLRNEPIIDAIISYPRALKLKGRFFNSTLIRSIQKKRPDLLILLTNSFSSAWRAWQTKTLHRIGFNKKGRSLLLTHPISFPKQKEHLTDAYKRLLEPLGIRSSRTTPKLTFTKQHQVDGKKLLQAQGILETSILIGIHPGAAFGLAKCWPTKKFRTLIHALLSNPNVYILCFGTTNQQALNQAVCKNFPNRVKNLCGKTTLDELILFLGMLNVLISNDSGPMHMADSLSIPVISLFGSTDPALTAPYNNRNHVIYKGVSCSPCFRRTCPIDFRCMENISPKEVFLQTIDIINNHSPCHR